MEFQVPGSGVRFAVPDEWWDFCEMRDFRPPSTCYLYEANTPQTLVVSVNEVEPPRRDVGLPPFRKCKLAPILLAFGSPRCPLPPLLVELINSGSYRYRVLNGYHRFYASVAAGYSKLPVTF